MSKAALFELADRVEKASGEDRELDLAIHLALFPDGEIAKLMKYPRGFEGREGYAWDIQGGSVIFEKLTADGRCTYNGGIPLPKVTGSLDAAMTLVPEGWSVKLYIHPSENSADLYLLGDYSDGNRPLVLGPIEAEACATSALALTAASLRARAQQESKDDEPF